MVKRFAENLVRFVTRFDCERNILQRYNLRHMMEICRRQRLATERKKQKACPRAGGSRLSSDKPSEHSGQSKINVAIVKFFLTNPH